MNGIAIGPAEITQALPPTFLWMAYEWGLEVIRGIQTIQTPVLTTLMRFISALGSEALYVPVILFVLWCVEDKRGIRFGVLVIISVWINVFLKDIWGQPRPFNLDSSLGIITVSGYGAPSGQAQLALCFWIVMAAWLGKLWPSRRTVIWAVSVSFILLIGFTRLYLGLHFPTGIFAGWILGGFILFILFVFGPHMEKLLAAGGVRLQNISAAAVALLMNGLFPQERSFPALFLGFCLGYAMMKQRFPFSPQEDIAGEKPGLQIMIFRCFTGFVSTAALFLVLRLIFPGEGSLFRDLPIWGPASPFYDMGQFIRYGLLGFWVTAGVPRLFQRMGLAQCSL